VARARGLGPHLLSLLAFTAVAVGWALVLLYKGGGLPDVGSKPYELSAIIPSGAALAPGSRVTMAGVHVGKVFEVERQGRGARVVLQLKDSDVIPLARDSRVQVRQHTPVGENYIAVTAGRSSEKLESGDAVPVSQSDEFVDVDKVLSVLKGETRERARQTIQSLGGALDGHGQELNQIVGRASTFLKHSGSFVDVMYRDRREAGRLVDQLGDLTAAIGQRDQAIGTLADRGLTALGAIRDRDDALRRTIDELPESLRRVRRTTDTVRSVTAVAKPVVDDATSALRAVRPAVRRLRPASQAGRGVLHELTGAAPVLRTTLDRVTALSGPLSGALPKVHKTVCEVAPVLSYAKPYFPEALGILIGLGSASNSYDATGHLIRLAPVLSENSSSGAMPAEISQQTSDLLYSGLVGEFGGTSLNFDPYPKPGSLGRTVATSNAPLGPDAVERSGYKYPRIHADC
jgi:phospholipid/cholesterol/gamma-HCH transport system substrate-binding protein